MELIFEDAPKDLMENFADVLARLPNLKTLELLWVGRSDKLDRKYAEFPNIREMTTCGAYLDLIEKCPNLESLTFRRDFGRYYSRILRKYGAGLKRIMGVGVGDTIDLKVERELVKVPLIWSNRSIFLGCYRCSAVLPET